MDQSVFEGIAKSNQSTQKKLDALLVEIRKGNEFDKKIYEEQQKENATSKKILKSQKKEEEREKLEDKQEKRKEKLKDEEKEKEDKKEQKTKDRRESSAQQQNKNLLQKIVEYLPYIGGGIAGLVGESPPPEYQRGGPVHSGNNNGSQYQKGGPVRIPGSGSGDKIPFMAQEGGFFLNSRASKAIRKFQAGGSVSTITEPGESYYPPGTWGPMEAFFNEAIPRFKEENNRPRRQDNGPESEQMVPKYQKGGKVVLHWAGTPHDGSASNDYHATIMQDGSVKKTGDYNVFDKRHAPPMNSSSVGISIDAMGKFDGRWPNFGNFGPYAVKPAQYEGMANLTAQIMKDWGQTSADVNKSNVMTHAEVANKGDNLGTYGPLGPPPDMRDYRWDLWGLYENDKPGSGGDKIRGMIRSAFDGTSVTSSDPDDTSGDKKLHPYLVKLHDDNIQKVESSPGRCVEGSLNTMEASGVPEPEAAGQDHGNHPRGAISQMINDFGWKSIGGGEDKVLNSPYGDAAVSVLSRSQYDNMVTGGQIPSGALIFQTRHEDWNGTSGNSRGYDMAIAQDRGNKLWNGQPLPKWVYGDTKGVIALTPDGKTAKGATPSGSGNTNDGGDDVTEGGNGPIAAIMKSLGLDVNNSADGKGPDMKQFAAKAAQGALAFMPESVLDKIGLAMFMGRAGKLGIKGLLEATGVDDLLGFGGGDDGGGGNDGGGGDGLLGFGGAAGVSDPNVQAALNAIADAEGTTKYPNNGYNTIFGGEQFTTKGHPRKDIPFGNTTSDAAGRYQFLSDNWDSFNGGKDDMSPAHQDAVAAKLIKDKKKVDLSDGLSMEEIYRLGGEWASIEGGPHMRKGGSYGSQAKYSAEKFASMYKGYGGKMEGETSGGMQKGGKMEGETSGGMQKGGMMGNQQLVMTEPGELYFPPGTYGPEIMQLNESIPRFQTGGTVGMTGTDDAFQFVDNMEKAQLQEKMDMMKNMSNQIQLSAMGPMATPSDIMSQPSTTSAPPILPNDSNNSFAMQLVMTKNLLSASIGG